MYGLLGLCLALSALLTINAFASLGAMLLWRGVSNFTCGWASATRARFLFALRIFPAMAATICVVAFLVPSYLAYEPRRTGEIVSAKLAALALLSAVGIALAVWRGIAAWRATRRLLADWMRHGEAIALAGVAIPAYRIEHRFPVIAVVGVIRPRLFIASRVLDALSTEELKAAIAHEVGHLTARDNLKRWLIRACRDVLVIVPTGRALDRAWSEATEAAADEYAAHAGAFSALDLAASLVKIARMAPAGAKPTMPVGAFLIGDDDMAGSIEARVHRLARIAEADGPPNDSQVVMRRATTWICFSLLLVFVALAATNPRVLAALHASIEQIVSALS